MDTVGTAWMTLHPRYLLVGNQLLQRASNLTHILHNITISLRPTPNRAAPIDHQKRDKLTANITSNSETEASTMEQLRKENALQRAQLNEYRSLRQQVIEMKGQHNNQQQRARLDSNLPISL